MAARGAAANGPPAPLGPQSRVMLLQDGWGEWPSLGPSVRISCCHCKNILEVTSAGCFLWAALLRAQCC